MSSSSCPPAKAPCAAPIPWARLVDYWAADLDEVTTDEMDEHLFACASCSAQSARVASVARALRAAVPAVISLEQARALRAGGLTVVDNDFVPFGRREVVFEPDVDVLVHHLTGLDLGRAERVEVTGRVASTGAVLFEDPFAPFDREGGAVLIACQKHFAGLPTDIVFDVRAHGPEGAGAVVTFAIPHVYGGGSSG